MSEGVKNGRGRLEITCVLNDLQSVGTLRKIGEQERKRSRYISDIN